MKKILIITNALGGLYNFRRELVEKLIEEGYNVTVAARPSKKSAYFVNMGCRFIGTRFDRKGINPLEDIRLFLNYYQIIRKENPDAVLTYTIKPNIYGGIAASLRAVPYLPNITGLGTAVENKGFLQPISLMLYRKAMKKAHCIFFQNNENIEFMQNRNMIRSHYRLLPGSGVNLDFFKILDYPSDENVHFLFIGRILKEKGIEQYLAAAQHIKEKYPHTIFHVLGSCEDNYSRRLNYMQKKEIIIYHGGQDDVRAFYKIAHCTIHPTYYPEGMSNVLLESAACGRPVITSNRSGCREIVNDGVNGFLVEPKNTEALIQKIEEFLALDNSSRKKMGIEGRKKVEKEFDRRGVTQAYFEEINRITR